MASGPITSWQIDGETMETATDFIFLGSKITADGDYSHEIKRHLLLGRKVMTNIDSILKSRDITLLTKADTVKAMVFPVVTQGCESWTIKKVERQRRCFWTMVLEKTLESPLDCKEINQSIPKEISSEYSLEGLMLKLQHCGHMMQRTDSLEKTLMLGKIEGGRGRARENEMVGWRHWLNGDEFEQALGVGDGQGSPVCCSLWCRKELDMTERLNWTEKCRHLAYLFQIMITTPSTSIKLSFNGS